ncbi:MAG TPA: TetR/AcrR family transcriptional regulator [Bacteroidales bacterium]|nr:TetR/AcrR family transcriptional regulator [Bacteroidales bacterium]
MNEELNNILEKVKNLYIRYGIKSVTMDDVARELGISKKTLYQHVLDKNDLVMKVFDFEVSDTFTEFDCAFNSNSNAIEQLFDVHKWVTKKLKDHSPVSDYDLKKYYPDLYKKLSRIRKERIYNFIVNNLRKGIEEGLYREELDVEIIAKIHVSRIQNTFDSDLLTNEEKTSLKVFYEFFVYHIRGIASDKGIHLLEEKLQNKELQLS